MLQGQVSGTAKETRLNGTIRIQKRQRNFWIFPKATIPEGDVDSSFGAANAKEYKPHIYHILLDINVKYKYIKCQ